MDQKIVAACADFAKRIDVPLSYLLAFVEVESSGQALWPVGNKRLPAIRIEGHYFYKLLSGDKRDQAVRLGLAAKKAGVIKNPKDYQGRYAMLERMKEIDEEIAYQSISIGLGQVMGANYKAAGALSAIHMFSQASGSEAVYMQVGHMANFINADARLRSALKRGEWRTVAVIYNGPAQKGYDVKMEKAARNYLVAPYSGSVEAVDDRKDRIIALGYEDVKAFQKEQGLKVDGKIGNATTEALEEEEKKRESTINAKRNSALKLAGTAIGGSVTVAASASSGIDLDQITNYIDTANRLVGIDWRIVVGVVGAVGVGFLVKAGYEWWKNRSAPAS